MSKMFGLVKNYFLIFLVFSLLYLLLFHSPLFSSVGVLFYRGVLLLLVSFLCFVFGYVALRKKIGFRTETFLAALVMSLSLHLAFFVVFPVTFERSITMFFLKELSLEALPFEQAEEILIKDYIIGKQAVAKRVEEQKIIGFISVTKDDRTRARKPRDSALGEDIIEDRNQYLQITNKGRKFLDFANIVSSIYGIE